MRQLLILIVLLCAFSLEGRSQEKMRIYLGIDVLKTAFPLFDKKGYYDKAIIIEPNLRIETVERVFLTIQVGYSDIGKATVYTNFTEYKNKGAYLKVGILYSILDDELDHSRLGISTGLNVTLARFKESGIAYLAGPIYGDFKLPFSNSRSSAGLELIPLNFLLKLSSRWKLDMQPRINFLSPDNSDAAFPVYYTPGVGSNERKKDKLNIPGRTITGGFTVQLFYKLR